MAFERWQGVRAVQGTRWRQVDISGMESHVVRGSEYIMASEDDGGQPDYEVIVWVPFQYQSLLVPSNFPIPELRDKPVGEHVVLLDADLEDAGWRAFPLDARIFRNTVERRLGLEASISA